MTKSKNKKEIIAWGVGLYYLIGDRLHPPRLFVTEKEAEEFIATRQFKDLFRSYRVKITPL